MAVLNKPQRSSEEKVDFLQKCLHDTKLQAVKPKIGSDTEFRPIPEFAPDGSVLPMVKGRTPDGLDFSNAIVEDVIMNAGVSTRITAICRTLDGDNGPISNIFSGMFIRLRAREKKDGLADATESLRKKIVSLLEERPVPNTVYKARQLPRSIPLMFMQGVLMSLNGKALEKARSRQALVFGPVATASIADVLEKAHKDGIDIFDPANGYTIHMKTLKADKKQGRQQDVLIAELGRKLPLNVDKCKSIWTPWKDAMIILTVEEQLKKACACFGADVVQYAFPDEFAMYIGDKVAEVVKAEPAKASAPTSAVADASIPTLDIDDSLPPPLAADAAEDFITDELPAATVPPAKVVTPPKTASKQPSAEELAKQYKDIIEGV